MTKLRVEDTDTTLRAGRRGRGLLEDFHFTVEGNFDPVGNGIPVVVIQDTIRPRAVVTEPGPEDDPTADSPEPNAAPDAESGFEASVKGIGQGIAGKFKEMVGEFIDDTNLEEEGIVQRIDGQIRRSEAEHRQPPGEGPTNEN